MKHVPLVILVLAALPIRVDAQCMRWENQMSPCAPGVVAAGVCENPTLWTEGQQRQYNNWQYSSGALKSCEKIIEKHVLQNPDIASRVKCFSGTHKLLNFGTWTAASPPYNAEGYMCTCDWNHDGVTNATDASIGPFPVTKAYLSPEPVCSATPTGPYKDIYGSSAPTGTPGGGFDDYMRWDVLAENAIIHNGTEGTDLLQIEGPEGALVTDPTVNQWATRYTHAPYNDDHDPETETMSANAQSAIGQSLQIDHIIPRFDIKGCPCGTNGVENTLVVSGTINNQMSNLVKHPSRRAILKEWTNYFDLYPDAKRGSDEGPQIEPAELGTEASGCAATGGGGFAMVGLVGLAMLRRSRRLW
jgi:MYXO-CTERM domain-containing protein